MGRPLVLVCSVAAALTPALASPAPPLEVIRPIVEADARIEAIGERLAIANGPSCSASAPITGMRLASLAEYEPPYRDAVRTLFRVDSPIIVEAVVPGSPAARAGIRAGDGVRRIAGRDLSPPPRTENAPATRDDLTAAYAVLFALPPAQPLTVTIRRDARERPITIDPVPGCRVRFELLLARSHAADSDEATVRIGIGLVTRLADDRLAAVIAHELAHIILHHAERRRQDRIAGGLAGELGRSARMSVAMEDEADRLSLHLLAKAGYEPRAAVALWREDGRAMSGLLPRGPSHRGWKARAALLEKEAATMAGAER